MGLTIEKREEKAYVVPTVPSDMLGANWAMCGVKDSLTLLHGHMGCANYINVLTTAETHEPGRLLTTGLAERDVIFGGEEQLKNAIAKAKDVVHPSMICIIKSTTSTLIGDDVDGIIATERSRIAEEGGRQIPIISVPTSALAGNFMTGFNLVVEALVDKVMEAPAQKLPHAVNILGVLPVIINAEADVMEMKRLLGKLGIEVHEVFCCGAEVDRIKRASEASLNLVVSEVMGIEAARKMEQRFGLPYRVVPYPIGLSNTKRLLEVVADFFKVSKARLDQVMAEEIETVDKAMHKVLYWGADLGDHLLYDSTAAIIGDSTYVLAVTRFLMEEWRVRPVLICLRAYAPESLEMLNQMERELGLVARVLLSPAEDRVIRALAEANPMMVLGGVRERVAIKRAGIEKTGSIFVQIGTYPSSGMVAGNVNIFPHPFAGFRGVVYLTEILANELSRARFESNFYHKLECDFIG